MLKSLKIFSNFGMMKTMMNVKMRDGDQDDHDRVDHGAGDLALEALGLFLEVGQALEDDFEGTAGLAGLDHVDVEAVEALGVLAERLGERAAGFDVVDDVDEGVLEHAGLHLPFEDLQAAQHRQAGVLQGRELAGEGARASCWMTPPMVKVLALLALAGPSSCPCLSSCPADLRDLGDEVAHLPDLLLGFFLVGGLDGVLDLAAGGVHRFVLDRSACARSARVFSGQWSSDQCSVSELRHPTSAH